MSRQAQAIIVLAHYIYTLYTLFIRTKICLTHLPSFRRQKEKRINPSSPLSPVCGSPTDLSPAAVYTGSLSAHPHHPHHHHRHSPDLQPQSLSPFSGGGGGGPPPPPPLSLVPHFSPYAGGLPAPPTAPGQPQIKEETATLG